MLRKKTDREAFARWVSIVCNERKDDPNVNPFETARELWRIANSLNHLNEVDANYGLSSRQVMRERNLQRRAAELADDLGFVVMHNGDPRGYALQFVLPSGRHNTWGGPEHGYGIGDN